MASVLARIIYETASGTGKQRRGIFSSPQNIPAENALTLWYPFEMITEQFFHDLLDSFKNPVMFVDTGHVIRYMNRTAINHYKEGASLLGQSVLDCHNEKSRQMIHEVFAAMQAGETERLITDDKKHRIYMRACE